MSDFDTIAEKWTASVGPVKTEKFINLAIRYALEEATESLREIIKTDTQRFKQEQESLRQRISELEKDRERLDWLSEQHYVGIPENYPAPLVVVNRRNAGPEELREAIDSAMKSTT